MPNAAEKKLSFIFREFCVATFFVNMWILDVLFKYQRGYCIRNTHIGFCWRKKSREKRLEINFHASDSEVGSWPYQIWKWHGISISSLEITYNLNQISMNWIAYVVKTLFECPFFVHYSQSRMSCYLNPHISKKQFLYDFFFFCLFTLWFTQL